MGSTTGNGLPATLKEMRSGSALQVDMDRVGQVLLRATCSDGFKAGFEAGLKAAAAAKPKTRGLADQLAEKLANRLAEAASELQTCNQVETINE